LRGWRSGVGRGGVARSGAVRGGVVRGGAVRGGVVRSGVWQGGNRHGRRCAERRCAVDALRGQRCAGSIVRAALCGQHCAGSIARAALCGQHCADSIVRTARRWRRVAGLSVCLHPIEPFQNCCFDGFCRPVDDLGESDGSGIKGCQALWWRSDSPPVCNVVIKHCARKSCYFIW